MFCIVDAVMDQTLCSDGTLRPNVGEPQRLSSLTFGCFQIRGKRPQVQTGPEPSQKSISTLQDRDHTHMDCRRPLIGWKFYIISFLCLTENLSS